MWSVWMVDVQSAGLLHQSPGFRVWLRWGKDWDFKELLIKKHMSFFVLKHMVTVPSLYPIAASLDKTTNNFE